MKIVALLPMKANSERVINKNFKIFGGKPLFKWMLDTLLDISQIDMIVINTDARSILEKYDFIDNERILIRDRDESICGDLVSMNLVIKNDIENIDADIFLMTHTTNPFLSRESIENGINKFQFALDSKKADSLFTVNKVQERFYDENSNPINHDPDNLIRTQDLDPYFKENSNMYLFTKNSFLENNARIGNRPIMLETPLYESLDIDNNEDWIFGEVATEYFKTSK